MRLKRQLSSIENQIKCSYPCSIPPHSAFTKKTMKSMKDSLTLRKRLGLEINRKLTDNLIAAHPLRQLFWECTLRCNLHCRHCGSDCKKIAGYQDMPKEDFLRVLDNIAAHTDPHKVFVILTGGEPLVRKDLEDCGRAIYEKGFPWGMVTNGLYLTPERLERLLQAGMHTATVSLDGFKEEHNWMRGHPQSFDRATAASQQAQLRLPGRTEAIPHRYRAETLEAVHRVPRRTSSTRCRTATLSRRVPRNVRVHQTYPPSQRNPY